MITRLVNRRRRAKADDVEFCDAGAIICDGSCRASRRRDADWTFVTWHGR